ncbi:class I SAM-dependent DNA methyltransferase [Leisingera daeponensis]|uniref:class I SAM-dependent DNA methyltransferase n=1 Tax=Leisingera daeponensis TaxID=405746 RepID=UPI001C954C0A|nr:DNA methyltransferase [Leisingera daeponensis]MBY6058600.1 N-6 DNA methylase [Leisingera daeponensis]
MSETVEKIKKFQEYAKKLDGDEKGEAQVFCDRLFQAFGHDGYKEAGATLEYRIKKNSTKGTSFADLVWKPRLLIEMKKRGEKLGLHYRQAFEYWLNAVPNRPRYVVLCNFDEFWIYDFDRQLDEPIDKVTIDEVSTRYTALNFIFPEDKEPIFNNDREGVSRQAANQTAELYRLLTRRKSGPIPREQAQRFVLQLVIAMFAEDIDLLPAGTVTSIITDCLKHGQSTYDLFGGLFKQMNDPKPATAGRYKGVPYFNGGLFSVVDPVDLTKAEMELIGGDEGAATKNWSKVNPAIFGTLFQQSMEVKARHQHGRHFTSEADIQRIVGPTIVRPWEARIDTAKTMQELLALRKELSQFRVLDPACGSGNFLYVAFRELSRLDIRLMSRLKALVSVKKFEKQAKVINAISPKQFYGLDNDTFGVELAKVTLMLAKKLALDEAIDAFSEGTGEFTKGTMEFTFHGEDALPLDNLDKNVWCADALFTEWPEVEAIVGNPPYQSKNKLQEEIGPAYLHKLRDQYPDIDGRSDYCVYWFRVAHDKLKPGQRAGLVGTNTIRQNYSRESGLDKIVEDGGTITEAVSSMIWPGAAVVHTSIVNWVKGEQKGAKRLYIQDGNLIDKGWRHEDLDRIPSSLSFSFDVTTAKPIKKNAREGGCFQGQTHGHKSFLIKPAEAQLLIAKDKAFANVLKPFLTSDDLVGQINSKPTRYVIDFSGLDILEAQKYSELYKRIEVSTLPDRKGAAEKEKERNKEVLAANPKANVNKHHEKFLSKWWQMSYPRESLMKSLKGRSRYIACGRITKRPIFDFVSTKINPNDALTVFSHSDNYSFGVLQSGIHWLWFAERCSTMKSDPRYTSNTVFDSFPWPQKPTMAQVKKVAKRAIALRNVREELRLKHDLSLRELYRTLELPGAHPLKAAHESLDTAVREAYGMSKKNDPLEFLLQLNSDLVAAENAGKPIEGPGLPSLITDPKPFITAECIKP